MSECGFYLLNINNKNEATRYSPNGSATLCHLVTLLRFSYALLCPWGWGGPAAR